MGKQSNSYDLERAKCYMENYLSKNVRSFICSYDAITCILVISMCYLLYDYRKMGKGG